MCTGNGILERKTIEKWEWDFNSSNRKAGIVGFELGFEKKKNNLLGNGIRTPPSGPSVEKQKQQMIKLRNLGGAEKLFFCHKMNKSASTGGFSLLMKLFIQVYENK